MISFTRVKVRITQNSFHGGLRRTKRSRLAQSQISKSLMRSGTTKWWHTDLLWDALHSLIWSNLSALPFCFSEWANVTSEIEFSIFSSFLLHWCYIYSIHCKKTMALSYRYIIWNELMHVHTWNFLILMNGDMLCRMCLMPYMCCKKSIAADTQ